MIRIFILTENKTKTIINVDNDTDAQNLLNAGAYEMPQSDVIRIFGEYANMVSNDTCTIDEQNQVTFNYTPPSLDTLKQAKLNELKTKSDSFRTNIINKDMYITSSLGFVADADKDSQDNVQGLINILTASGAESTDYKDRDNKMHLLTLAQLKTLLIEMQANGSNLFKQKWNYEIAIKACENKEALDAIEFDFVMLDFTKINLSTLKV